MNHFGGAGQPSGYHGWSYDPTDELRILPMQDYNDIPGKYPGFPSPALPLLHKVSDSSSNTSPNLFPPPRHIQPPTLAINTAESTVNGPAPVPTTTQTKALPNPEVPSTKASPSQTSATSSSKSRPGIGNRRRHRNLDSHESEPSAAVNSGNRAGPSGALVLASVWFLLRWMSYFTATPVALLLRAATVLWTRSSAFLRGSSRPLWFRFWIAFTATSIAIGHVAIPLLSPEEQDSTTVPSFDVLLYSAEIFVLAQACRHQCGELELGHVRRYLLWISAYLGLGTCHMPHSHWHNVLALFVLADHLALCTFGFWSKVIVVRNYYTLSSVHSLQTHGISYTSISFLRQLVGKLAGTPTKDPHGSSSSAEELPSASSSKNFALIPGDLDFSNRGALQNRFDLCFWNSTDQSITVQYALPRSLLWELAKDGECLARPVIQAATPPPDTGCTAVKEMVFAEMEGSACLAQKDITVYVDGVPAANVQIRLRDKVVKIDKLSPTTSYRIQMAIKGYRSCVATYSTKTCNERKKAPVAVVSQLSEEERVRRNQLREAIQVQKALQKSLAMDLRRIRKQRERQLKTMQEDLDQARRDHLRKEYHAQKEEQRYQVLVASVESVEATVRSLKFNLEALRGERNTLERQLQDATDQLLCKRRKLGMMKEKAEGQVRNAQEQNSKEYQAEMEALRHRICSLESEQNCLDEERRKIVDRVRNSEDRVAREQQRARDLAEHTESGNNIGCVQAQVSMLRTNENHQTRLNVAQ